MVSFRCASQTILYSCLGKSGAARQLVTTRGVRVSRTEVGQIGGGQNRIEMDGKSEGVIDAL